MHATVRAQNVAYSVTGVCIMKGLCLKSILYPCVGAEQQIVSDFKVRHPGRHTAGALIQASGKLVLIDKLLPKLKEKGHKVEQT